MATYPAAGISVIMPTYNQAPFIERALASLFRQEWKTWQLIIINDGCTDDTHSRVEPFLHDDRIIYLHNTTNQGLGKCLNMGLDTAQHKFIAYLPSDDLYYSDHLSSLYHTLLETPASIMAYSGVRYHYNRMSTGKIEGYSIQLVQVMHRNIGVRWLEREDLVTDDLERMFWNQLKQNGMATGTGRVTCEWVDHPHQRHKLIREPLGGINPYKVHYGITQPLRFHSTVGNLIDEVNYYQRFRNAHQKFRDEKRLKIVLVGELAYNPERVLAFEERGHQLFGLWMREPYWYNYVGPLPFGNIKDIPYNNWQERVKEIQPDIIYALLNWQAVPFAHEILKKNPGIPFVWHFKEGPFICLEKGTWHDLIDLYTYSDAQIFTSPEMMEWFKQFLPPSDKPVLVLDGDLPKKDWFTDERTPLLSARDGEIHTVVPGRPIGLHPHTVQALGQEKIHVHFYGDFTHGQWREWIQKTMKLATGYLHIHNNCSQENWVKEFSQYDAGWLHFFKSENCGELMRANWDDLNYPARLSTLAAAGLPMLQRNNSGHAVATQSLVKEHNLGVFFSDIADLANQLRNHEKMNVIRQEVWRKRMMFTFDHHTEDLINFFITTIDHKNQHGLRHTGIFSSAVGFGNTTAAAYREPAGE